MALKVELKPNERIIIGNAVIRNGEQRTRFFIEGDAPILREKDILTPATADTAAKRIYLAVQLMYLQQDLSTHHDIYFPLVRDFLTAAPSAMPLIAEVNNLILNGDLYKALRSAKKLVAYEQDLIDDALRGERVHEGRTGHAVAAGA
ncbi:MAG TPA: flagellar biosynthesis repressor FlbT [Microvirga sp.]|jgi:flagellar protein FlbT